jgi:hypothetical protein
MRAVIFWANRFLFQYHGASISIARQRDLWFTGWKIERRKHLPELCSVD